MSYAVSVVVYSIIHRQVLGAVFAVVTASLNGSVLADADYWRLPVPPQGKPPASHHPLTHDLSAKACGLCHQQTHKQWSSSIHAKAMSPGLAGQLGAASKENREACLACHTPRSEQWERWHAQGAAALRELDGIDCAGCHVRTHKRHGPRDVANTPHGQVAGLALFKRSEFCMKCHQFPPDEGVVLNGKPLENTYNEWRASRYAKEGRTCQSCHMPEGDHGFRGIHDPGMTRRGLQVDVTRTAQGMFVRAANVGAGHALPTYVTPRIVIQAATTAQGASKQANYVIQRRVHWDPKTGWSELSDTRLLPDQSIELPLPLSRDQTADVRVIVQPDADYHDRVYPLLLAQQRNLTAADRLMLETARAQGIKNAYTLYSFKCGPFKGAAQSCQEDVLAANHERPAAPALPGD